MISREGYFTFEPTEWKCRTTLIKPSDQGIPILYKTLEILYDNGKSHIEKGIIATNAKEVLPVDEVGERYLTFSRSEPDEIKTRVFQEANYAVDMFDVAGIRLVDPQGNVTIRKIKPCCSIKVNLSKEK